MIPFVTALAKRLFKTNTLPDPKRAGINTLIPIVLGILSSGLYAYSVDPNIWAALAVGLGSGGAASSVRDIDKHLLKIVESILKISKK